MLVHQFVDAELGGFAFQLHLSVGDHSAASFDVGNDDPRCSFGDSGPVVGQGIRFSVKKVRNVLFHRKFFALLGLAFDAWEPDTDVRVDGMSIRKDREGFRKNVLVLAGFCDAHYDLNGGVSFAPHSISFASMDEVRFAQLYQAVLDVVWTRILRHCRYKNQQELENVVLRLMQFS